MKMTKAFWALAILGVCAVLVGCSSSGDESKGVDPANGPKQPTVAGATNPSGGGGGGGGQMGTAKGATSAQPQ